MPPPQPRQTGFPFPFKHLIKLIKITLTRNDFIFDNQFYRQHLHGRVGTYHFDKVPLEPFIYKQYLDDIFMIWTHGLDALNHFFQTINGDNACIKLVAKHSTTTINFLDLTLYIDPQHPTRIQTKIYHKPTDTMQLLHKSSFHPHHTFSGLIKSQIICFHRLSFQHENFLHSWKELVNVLDSRGYKNGSLMPFSRELGLNFPSPPCPKPPLHPGPHPILCQIPTYKPQAAPCRRPPCKVCSYIHPTTTFSSTVTKQIFPIPSPMSCSSTGIIYLVTCDTCSLQYVGMTKNDLHHRF